MQGKLKDILGNSELTWLKRKAKLFNILPDKTFLIQNNIIFLKKNLKTMDILK